MSVPDDLQQLHGAVEGRVRLPLLVYPSGRGPAREFDLSIEAERVELYQIVLTDGSLDDVCSFLNAEELQRLWPHLWLPAHVRRAWQPLLDMAAR